MKKRDRPKRGVESSGTATTGGITGKGFKPGQSGNPGGRAKTDPHLKEFLASRGVDYFLKAENVLERALKKGDMKAAATVIGALLKKVAPDADVILVHRTEPGAPVEVAQTVAVTGEVKTTAQIEVRHDVDDHRLGGILALIQRSGAEAVVRRADGAAGTPDAEADAVHSVATDADAGGGAPPE